MEYNTGETFSVGIVEHQFDKTWSGVLTWYTGFHPAFSFNCSEIQFFLIWKFPKTGVIPGQHFLNHWQFSKLSESFLSLKTSMTHASLQEFE